MLTKAIVREPDELYTASLTMTVVWADLTAVRKLAFELHAQKTQYAGEAFGWPAYYYPMQSEPPLESSLSFTPASFILGSWPVWSLSFDWENEDDQEPLLFVWDKNSIRRIELDLSL